MRITTVLCTAGLMLLARGAAAQDVNYVVGMIEAKSHSMVWRVAATKDLDLCQSPEKWERSLNKAVETMLKRYPGSGQAVR